MDINFFISFFFALILIVMIIEWQEAMLLFIIAFFGYALFFNLEAVFGITITSYNGWGRLMQMVFFFIPLFALLKTYVTAKEHGVDQFFGKLKRKI